MTPYDANKLEIPGTDLTATRPSREQAEEAVRTLIHWAGDDPDREGLKDTPARVVRSYEEFYAGYQQNAADMLARTFEEVEGYDDMVLLRDIRLTSHCEHHMVPIIGTATIGYLPDRRVVGISKLARVIDIFARRLQTQETMTAQITDAIQHSLQPRGVALLIDASHECMTTRGVNKPDVSMVTTRFTGVFESDASWRQRFLAQAGTAR